MFQPYRRGPRASFFKNSHPKASQLPDIVGKQFGVPVTRKNNRDSKKVKRVTIADEPESYDKSPNIAMKEDIAIGIMPVICCQWFTLSGRFS